MIRHLQQFTPALLLTAAMMVALPAPGALAGGWLEDSTEESAEPAKRSNRYGKGTHHLSLFGGWHFGETASDTDIVTRPLDENVTHLRIDVENDPAFGFRYGYQVDEKWVVEGSLTFVDTVLANKKSFDEAAVRAVFDEDLDTVNGTVTPEEKEEIFQRLKTNGQTPDFQVTYLDIGALYLLDTPGPLSFEFGAGIGYASSSLDDGEATFENLVATECDPLDGSGCTTIIQNTLEGCADSEAPCVTLEDHSGLTWHATTGMRYDMTERAQLRGAMRLRFVEQLTNPGDSFLQADFTFGVSFLLGGE